jgi:hypothetical protein
MEATESSDDQIFSDLKIRILKVLYGRYPVLYNYLTSCSDEDLLSLYYDYTSTGDWRTLESSKAEVDAHVKLIREKKTDGGWTPWITGILGRVGLGIPTGNYCDAYIDRVDDQLALFQIFVDYRTAVKNLEDRQFSETVIESESTDVQ